ncbi:MAG: membrane protein insertion efficiency factor YidD [Deltaproteobacteria bacterium]|nr:membrane protein insertion efficiency factor YidD [Deltaproteobacteria bacterium]MBW2016319.1 membrane protein insertion efficiency factor YidD [Deltaproteobacteria bacterium]MBW2128903.1 membrane protein insertion efficiency factor YidD [Deltaproteobacteria bacterium]MBW2303864.1 membrane protein insertion efficiency factor YidD [Deltaproteobacteria bacterium]
MRIFRLAAFCILFSLLTLIHTAAWGGENRSAGSHESNLTGTLNPGVWLVSFIWKHISAVDGDRCPSYPSCSAYSRKAFKKHGFFIGWIMTVDRLIHEGQEEYATSPAILSDGKWKIYDPVENNDFWWYDRKKKDSK